MGKASAETKGSKSWETTTGSGQNGLDPQTQAWKDMIFKASQGAGGGIPDSVKNALGFLSGDAAAGKQFMSPYMDQVIGGINKEYAVGNQMLENGVNDAASKSGAFGGARHGIAYGTALGENTRNRDAQIAGLLQSGFEGATGRAMGAANLGMMAGSPELWQLMQLKNGFSGTPYGTNYSNTSGRTNTSAEYGFKGKLGLFGG